MAPSKERDRRSINVPSGPLSKERARGGVVMFPWTDLANFVSTKFNFNETITLAGLVLLFAQENQLCKIILFCVNTDSNQA